MLLTENFKDSLCMRIETLAEKMHTSSKLTVPEDEFYQCYIAPEDIGPLTHVAGLIRRNAPSIVGIPTPDGTFRVTTKPYSVPQPLLLPQYTTDAPRGEVESGTWAKIREWAEEHIQMSKLFGDADDAISYMRSRGYSLEAAAYVLPCIGPLLAMSIPYEYSQTAKNRLQKAVDVLERKRAEPPSIPLPRTALSHFRNVSAFIQGTILVPPNETSLLDKHDRGICLEYWHQPHNKPKRSSTFALALGSDGVGTYL